jgi:putative ATP-binding cassette transporter
LLNVARAWLREMIKLSSRRWLSIAVFDEWLSTELADSDIGINPDQRLHEDARHLSESSAELGIGLFQALLLMTSFTGVLWTLSENVVFSLTGRSVSIPAYMVGCALIYAAIGSWLTWRVGRPLLELGSRRYAREADLRFARRRDRPLRCRIRRAGPRRAIEQAKRNHAATPTACDQSGCANQIEYTM